MKSAARTGLRVPPDGRGAGPCEYERVARYDVNCELCGIAEVYARCGAGPLHCPSCGLEAPQHFSPRSVPSARIDSAGEDSADPRRIADGTAGFNLGLRGVEEQIGVRPDGKPMLSYRPLTNAEVSSNHARSERAKRQGMTPFEGKTYRPLGGK